jgi:putative oxidoreductase
MVEQSTNCITDQEGGMNLGLLALRVIVGLLFIGHGTQKLFGWFGGPGLETTGGFFEQLGLPHGKRQAALAGLAEAGSGLLLALGLLTPLATAMVTATMLVAVAKVHFAKGLWNTNGGYEFNLVLAAAAFAVAAIGAGKWSLDHLLKLHVAGTGWGLAALGAGLLAGVLALVAARFEASRRHPPVHPTAA